MSAGYKFADVMSTIGNGIANFFGINLKQFNDLYSKSARLRSQVDSLAEQYMLDYDNKVATSTPSTKPQLAAFIKSKLDKDKDRILALQRSVKQLDDDIQRDSQTVVFDIEKNDNQAKQLETVNKDYNNLIQSLDTNVSKIAAKASRYADNKFATAFSASHTTRKDTTNGVQKEQ